MQSESPKEITDYYKHLSLFWTDIIHLMSSKPQALASIGPMRAFAANSKNFEGVVEMDPIFPDDEKIFKIKKIIAMVTKIQY